MRFYAWYTGNFVRPDGWQGSYSIYATSRLARWLLTRSTYSTFSNTVCARDRGNQRYRCLAQVGWRFPQRSMKSCCSHWQCADELTISFSRSISTVLATAPRLTLVHKAVDEDSKQRVAEVVGDSLQKPDGYGQATAEETTKKKNSSKRIPYNSGEDGMSSRLTSRVLDELTSSFGSLLSIKQ